MAIPWSKAGSTIYEIATAPMGPRNDVEFLGFAMTVFFGDCHGGFADGRVGNPPLQWLGRKVRGLPRRLRRLAMT